MIIKTKLYQDTVTLMFDSFKHQYKHDNVVVPSVTTCLGIINKPALVNWASGMCADSIAENWQPGKIYDEIEIQKIIETGRKAHYQKKIDSGSIGTMIHHWVELYIKGQNPDMPVNKDLQDSVNQFLAWVKVNNVEFLLSEQQIFSKKYNYTGTLDFICKIDGNLYIGDLKTSSGIYPEYLIQTAAYRAARSEEFPNETYKGQLILRIGREGGFEIAIVNNDEWYKKMFTAFTNALELFRNMEQIKGFKPEIVL
jgi:hypothetical protein